jgi:hypothetical protein
MRWWVRGIALSWLLIAGSGCILLPTVAHQPSVHNPFPQLTRVAVAPFFNLSAEPTVDGRQFALAYYNELQLVPGFEVVPVGIVEKAIEAYHISLGSAAEVRKLAQILEVDAVVIGSVTDFTMYYPPRVAMQVEWYAANPCFHPIPPGYGLPWGTREEEFIPAPLVQEAEMALARAQLKTQTPVVRAPVVPPPPLPEPQPLQAPDPQAKPLPPGDLTAKPSGVKLASATTGVDDAIAPGVPPNWPDPRGFIPPPPCAQPAECIPSNEPVLKHTKTYNGQDSSVTEALASYYFFQDEARFGGWQAYLQRSDDFIRFCCHLHIYEMLGARGGAGETRVVWRWSTNR